MAKVQHVCSLTAALDLMGDAWTLVIVREAFLGSERFGDFRRQTGIAKNVLADRLQRLVDHNVFEKVDIGDSGVRYVYRLTLKGEELMPILVTMYQWADKWVYGEGNEPLLFKHAGSGELLPKLVLRRANGQPIDRRQVIAEPGPGADAPIKARFA